MIKAENNSLIIIIVVISVQCHQFCNYVCTFQSNECLLMGGDVRTEFTTLFQQLSWPSVALALMWLILSLHGLGFDVAQSQLMQQATVHCTQTISPPSQSECCTSSMKGFQFCCIAAHASTYKVIELHQIKSVTQDFSNDAYCALHLFLIHTIMTTWELFFELW